MFSSPFFDSIISMLVLYLIFSQLTLSLTELAAGPLNSRGRYLYDHLGTALGPAARQAFYLAAPIQALMSSEQGQNFLLRKLGISRWPAYVSETLFAQTLIALVSAAAPATVPAPATPPVAIDQFKAGLGALQAAQPQLIDLLTPLYLNAMAAGTPEAQSQNLQKNIELWFREFGSRMSGWYKRDNRKWLFLTGLVVAVLADVDTVRLARFLADSANAKARAALVDLGSAGLGKGAAPVGMAYNPADRKADSLHRAKQQGRLDSVAVKAFQNTLDAVPQVGLPLGWLRWRDTSTVPDDTTTLNLIKGCKRAYAKPLPCSWAPSADDYKLPAYAQRWTLNKATGQIGHPAGWSWWQAIGGWLLTAFAMMVGAPFWFDTLCRFVNIRNVGIKPAKATTT